MHSNPNLIMVCTGVDMAVSWSFSYRINTNISFLGTPYYPWKSTGSWNFFFWPGGRGGVTRAFCAGFGKERERATDGAWWGWTRDWWLDEIWVSELWGREGESVCREVEVLSMMLAKDACVLTSQCVTVTVYMINKSYKMLRSGLSTGLNVVWMSFFKGNRSVNLFTIDLSSVWFYFLLSLILSSFPLIFAVFFSKLELEWVSENGRWMIFSAFYLWYPIIARGNLNWTSISWLFPTIFP